MNILVCMKQVPVNCVARFLHFVHDMAEDTGIRILSFGHAGDGNLHVYLCRDSIPDGIWEEKLLDCFEKMYQEAASMGDLYPENMGLDGRSEDIWKNSLRMCS